MERLNAKSAVERVAGFVELKLIQQLCGQTFVHSDDSTVVLNFKDDVGTGQKMVSASSH